MITTRWNSYRSSCSRLQLCHVTTIAISFQVNQVV